MSDESWKFLGYTEISLTIHVAGLVVNYGISNTVVLEIP